MAHPVLRTGYDAPGINRLQPNVPEIFLRLRFKDPQDNTLDFPAGFPVTVEFGGNVNHHYDGRTEAGGRLRFTLNQNPGIAGGINQALPQNSPLRTFTLCWDLTQMNYIVCDNNAPPNVLGASNTITPGSPPYQANSRYFGLPRRWFLRQADIDPAPTFGAGDGAWDAARAAITLQRPNLDQDVGSDANPVTLVLKLYWHFFRFEFFDRRWGHSADHGHQRVSIPPIRLKGYRANNPAVADQAETDSNWTIPVAGTAAQEIVQCLPWLLRYNTATPRAALPDLTGDNMGLLFQNPARTYVHCQNSTTRSVLTLPVNDARVDPSADRLDYYDLPQVWKSRGYYARIGANGKFFKDVTAGEVRGAQTAANRLAFSLDDLVLTNSTLAPILLDADHRVALFHHQFIQTAPGGGAYSNEGVYEPGADSDPVNWQGYPYTNPATLNLLEARTNYDATAAAGKRYYIHVYPNWTRLAVAQGSLFDVFDRRTPDGAHVVGARAAVRWVNGATAAPAAATVRPGIALHPSNDARATFALQTFCEQKFPISYSVGNPETGPAQHIEWNARYATERDEGGRFDTAVLRCADRDGADEVAILIRYFRLHFDFETADTSGASAVPNPFRTGASPPPPVARDAWVKTAIDNLAARWNGHDAVNTRQAEILPRPAALPAVAPAIKIKIVNLFQAVRLPWAHFDFVTIAAAGTSSAGSNGAGLLRVNCIEHDAAAGANDAWGAARRGRGLPSAHELGHCGSLPDEYLTDNQLYRHWSLLGAPYLDDTRALMRWPWQIRARYFWHAAEWLRLMPAFNTVNFRVSRAPDEPDYFLPHYPHAGGPAGKRLRHFANWPISFNIRATQGGKSRFDAALWILGEDRFSSAVLPGLLNPAPPGRVDGILVVMVRIEVDLTTMNAAVRTQTLTDFHTNVSTAVSALLNRMRRASFTLRAAGGDPSFNCCYLHFMVAMAQTGNALLNSARPHIRISFSPAPPAPAWNPDSSPPNYRKTLQLALPANFHTLALAQRQLLLQGHTNTVRDRIVETVGLDVSSPTNPMYYQTPAAYRGFFRAVAEAGIANPNVT